MSLSAPAAQGNPKAKPTAESVARSSWGRWRGAWVNQKQESDKLGGLVRGQIKPSSSQHRGPDAKGTFLPAHPQGSMLNTTDKCSLNHLSTKK